MNKKKAIIILGICGIICVITIIILINILKNEEEYQIDEGNLELYIDTSVFELRDYNLLFTVESIINNKIKNIDKFYAQKIYCKELKFDVETQIYIYGTIWTNNYTKNESDYIMITLDKDNMLFDIKILQRNISEQEFEQYIKQINDENIEEIQYNTENIFSWAEVQDDYICERYLNYYITLALYSPEKAYELLDSDYREQEYGSLEKYLEYVNSNKNTLASTSEYYSFVRNQGKSSRYIILDTNEKYYIFTVNNIFDIKLQISDSYEE